MAIACVARVSVRGIGIFPFLEARKMGRAQQMRQML